MISNKRAEKLRSLFSDHVQTLNSDLSRPWKGPVKAVVPKEISVDVRDAMNFIGAVVDRVDTTESGDVELYSRGYYFHTGA